MADGSIVIETGLDTGGFEKGLHGFLTQIKNEATSLGTEFGASMVSGLQKQLPALRTELNKLSTDISKALTPTLKQVSGETNSCVSGMAGSLTDGDLQSSFAQLETLFGRLEAVLCKLTDDAIPKLTQAFDLMGDSAGRTSPMVDSLSSGLENYSQVASAAADTNAVWQNLKDGEWIGVIISAVAGLINWGVSWIRTTKQEESATQKLIDSIQEEAEALGTLSNQQKERDKAAVVSIDYTKRLYDELRTLTDTEGNVLQGNKDRVAFIVDHLNKVMPGAIDLINEEKVAYRETDQTLQNLIMTQKAMAILKSREGSYQNAINEVDDAEVSRAQTLLEIAEKRLEVSQKLKSHFDLLYSPTNISNNPDPTGELDNVKELNRKITELTGTLGTSTNSLTTYYDTIAGYENLQAAVISGNTEEISKAMDELSGSFEVAADQSIEEQERMVVMAEINYQSLLQKYVDGEESLTKSTVDHAKERAEQAREKYVELGGILPEAMADGAGNKQYLLSDKMQEIVDTALAEDNFTTNIASQAEIITEFTAEQLKNYSPESPLKAIQETETKLTNQVNQTIDNVTETVKTKAEASGKEIGKPIADGTASGITENTPYVEAAARQMVDKAKIAAQAQAKIHSPSKVMRDEVGAMIARGVAVGIEQNAQEATDAFENLVDGLDYQRDLDLISEASYYAQLERYRDEYLTRGTKEWMDATVKIYKFKKDQADKEADRLGQQYKDGKLSAEQYYTALQQIQADHFEQGTEAWEEYTERISEIADDQLKVLDDYKSQVSDLWAEMAKSAWDNMDDVLDAQDKLADKLKGYGKLYEETTTTFAGMGRGLVQDENGVWYDEPDRVITTVKLADISKDVDDLRAYRDALLAVKARGNVPPALFAALRDMSIEEGTKFAGELSRVPDDEFSGYIAQWESKQSLSDDIAGALYQDERKEAQQYVDEAAAVGDDIMEMCEELGLAIPETFLESGAQAGENFGEAFRQKLGDVLEKAKQMVSFAMGSLMPAAVQVAAAGMTVRDADDYHRVYQTANYNFYSSGETTSQQIAAAKAAAELDHTRGIV